MEKASLPVACKSTDDSEGDVGCAPAGYADHVVDVNRAAFLVRRRPLHGLYNASTLSSTIPVAKRCIDSKLGRGRRGTAGEVCNIWRSHRTLVRGRLESRAFYLYLHYG